MQYMQNLDHVAQVDAVNFWAKQLVDDEYSLRRTMSGEFVGGVQHVVALQRRAHGGEGARHVLAEPTCGNASGTHPVLSLGMVSRFVMNQLHDRYLLAPGRAIVAPLRI